MMITVFKQDDTYRWIAISSTAYRDRDGEIVSTKALRDSVDRNEGSDLGPLRFWHVPGLDIGTTDYQELTDDGKYLIESGTIPDSAIAENVIESLKENSWQMSIGFRHPLDEPDENKVFNTIQIFERSIVPGGRAANPQTTFMIGGS